MCCISVSYMVMGDGLWTAWRAQTKRVMFGSILSGGTQSARTVLTGPSNVPQLTAGQRIHDALDVVFGQWFSDVALYKWVLQSPFLVSRELGR